MSNCKPRPISGNLPFDAIKKDFNRLCGKLVGDVARFFLPVPTPDSIGTLINDFTDAADFINLGSGTATTDAVEFFSGGASVRCDMVGAQNVNLRYNLPAPIDFAKKSLLIRWKAADRLAMSASQVYLHVGGTLQATFESVTGTWMKTDDEWWEMMLNMADLDNPSADISAIDSIRFRVAGEDTTVWMDECRVIDNVFPASLVFAFDDANETDYTIGKPILDTAGYVAASYIPTDSIDGVSKLTTAQIQEFDASGWDVGSHTETQINMDASSEAVQRAELSGSKQALQAIGINPVSFSYPQSSISIQARGVAAEYYPIQSSGVSVPGKSGAPSNTYMGFTYRIGEENFADVAAVTAYLDNLDLHGGLVEIFFHELGVDTPTIDFQAIVDHVKNNTTLVVTTLRDYYL